MSLIGDTQSAAVKRLLMIAYHYPPVGASSGVQRTLKFSAYLPEMGWQPSVLTVHPRAYESTRNDQLAEIPEQVLVRRAFAFDTARHLGIRGRYPLALALPDRWASWWIGGVLAGLAMIRKLQPHVLWSTYPIATAHLIGLTLQRLSGLPWVADFRDSMTEDHYPRHPTIRRTYRWIERRAVARAARVVFTTPGTLRMYSARYPSVTSSRWSVIENGYDEANFKSAESRPVLEAATEPLTLVHSGILYPSERDPSRFFDALAELKAEGRISASTLCIRLRGTHHDELFRRELDRRGISDIVSLEPPVDYEEALHEMLSANGLLIFQASNCNHQIPAKLYEYFRARRPVFGLTDPDGDTARAMRAAGLTSIARLDDTAEIKRELHAFLTSLRQRRASGPSGEAVASSSRRARTEQLAALLDSVVAATGPRNAATG
jgi:glycosyltransferase involved in cell wall biosynthesis